MKESKIKSSMSTGLKGSRELH